MTIWTGQDDYLIAMLDRDWMTCDELAAIVIKSKNQCYAVLGKEANKGNVTKKTRESLQVVYKLTKQGEQRAREFVTIKVRKCPHCGGVL